ncbi:MAG TPA: glycosyltransferase family 2 protein [Paludibacter sp.]|nr:glycosyltransferase family 2 protein [Paludibacter sp.]
MSKNKVSVLVPVYGVSTYIERCAHSLFGQTFKDIEYVFVDDCTPDDSIEKLNAVLDFYPQRAQSVIIIKHDKNRGISAARQTAFDAATGSYVLSMDSDDFVELEMVEELYKKAVETDADMVYCSYFSELKDKTVIGTNIFAENKLGLINLAISGNSAYWNKLIARKILVENNIKTLESISHGDDLAVIAKIIYYSNNFVFLDKPFYHYVQFNQNSVTKKFNPKYVEDRLKLVADLDTFFSSKPDYSVYKPSVWLLKALRKIRLIRISSAEKQFVDIYPEINNHISKLNLPFMSKAILWLAAKRYTFLLKCLLSFSNLKTQFISR